MATVRDAQSIATAQRILFNAVRAAALAVRSRGAFLFVPPTHSAHHRAGGVHGPASADILTNTITRNTSSDATHRNFQFMYRILIITFVAMLSAVYVYNKSKTRSVEHKAYLVNESTNKASVKAWQEGSFIAISSINDSLFIVRESINNSKVTEPIQSVDQLEQTMARLYST